MLIVRTGAGMRGPGGPLTLTSSTTGPQFVEGSRLRNQIRVCVPAARNENERRNHRFFDTLMVFTSTEKLREPEPADTCMRLMSGAQSPFPESMNAST